MFRVLRAAAAAILTAVISCAAFAQQLTPAQETTLRAAILAEPALAAPLSIRNDPAIADYCNAATTQLAWRTVYSSDDLFQSTVLVEYIARSAAERQAYDLLVSIGMMDPSRARLRNAIADIFSGSTNSTSRGLILNDMTRFATWAERLFGGTNATTDTVTAWRLNWSGTISPSTVSSILNSGN